MKHLSIGFILGMWLLGLALWGVRVWNWRHVTNERGWAAEQTFLYLSEVVARDEHGRPISRGQVLDALARQAVAGGEKR